MTPDETKTPADKAASDVIVGIDLGTTNSLIGIYTDDGSTLLKMSKVRTLRPQPLA